MATYVDDMRAPFGRLIMCHLLADSDEELHAMADRIGVDRKWWQSPEKTSGSYYDIALSKRALAVKAGAIEITFRQAAAMNSRWRVTSELGEVRWRLDYSAAFRAVEDAAVPTQASDHV